MSRSKVFLLTGLALFLVSGCFHEDKSCRAIYCDDSGCHACDTDSCFCWDINNSPCEQGCAVDEVCTEDGVCARVCQFDVNCEEGERCMPEGYCGPADPPDLECASDDDCGAGLICEPDGEGGMTCQPAECQSDDDCDAGFVCAECGRCVPEDNPVCGDTKTYCETTPECGEGRVCNAAGKCIYECVDNSNCPYGQVCGGDNLCMEDDNPNHEDACVYSADCTSVSHCEARGCLCVNTYCHALCETNDDCGTLELCDMGVCRANYRP